MTRVTGRVALPYGRSQETTPVCGQVRYAWLGGVSDLGGQVLIPGVAVARIIDGVVEDINLSPGRWLPVLVVDGCRYDLPEIIVEASDCPRRGASCSGAGAPAACRAGTCTGAGGTGTRAGTAYPGPGTAGGPAAHRRRVHHPGSDHRGHGRWDIHCRIRGRTLCNR